MFFVLESNKEKRKYDHNLCLTKKSRNATTVQIREPLSFFFENTSKLNKEEICFYWQRNHLQRNFEEGMRLLGLQCCVSPSGIQKSANIRGW
jgi:hypothetical protein